MFFCEKILEKQYYYDIIFVLCYIQVISTYIHCIRDEKHLLYREGGKVFLENTYISSILKRDGTIKLDQLNYNEDTIETRVDNYLDHDMVNLNHHEFLYDIYIIIPVV